MENIYVTSAIIKDLFCGIKVTEIIGFYSNTPQNILNEWKIKYCKHNGLNPELFTIELI